MEKVWYPIIDYSKCTSCGACKNICNRGVFKQTSGKPVVENPQNCIYGCRDCQKSCKVGAIIYISEDW
ncbi:4Fe-4S binding protein [Thermoanaerobacter kivui]